VNQQLAQQLLESIGVDDGRREFKAKRGNAGFKSRCLQQFAMPPRRGSAELPAKAFDLWLVESVHVLDEHIQDSEEPDRHL